MKDRLKDALGKYADLRHQLDEKLIGEDGFEWAEQFKRFLHQEQTWTKGKTPAAKHTLAVWRHLKGGGTTIKKLLKDLSGMSTDWAKCMITNHAFTVSNVCYEAELVILTLRELGFTVAAETDEFMTEEFCIKWSAENLNSQTIELCEPEFGPQLCLEYEDQPKDEIIFLAMKRMTVLGKRNVFKIVRGNASRCLDGNCADPDGWRSRDERFVFRLREDRLSNTVK